jgi:hypothetical protein
MFSCTTSRSAAAAEPAALSASAIKADPIDGTRIFIDARTLSRRLAPLDSAGPMAVGRTVLVIGHLARARDAHF